MINFIKQHRYAIVLAIFIFIYVSYFTLASFLRYDSFFTGRFDLGNMDQTVWNTIHGRIFQLTDPDGTNIISRLSIHADFILILISPLYLIWSDPRMLLLLQSVILGLGGLFVFLIAKHVLKKDHLSLALSAAYLLNPSLQFANLYDFHAVSLATTFFLAGFYFFLKRSYLPMLLFIVLAGLTKEEAWATVGLFGTAIVFRILYQSRFRLNFTKKQLLEICFGIFIFIISTALCYLLIFKLIPWARGGNHFALEYYSQFGGNATEVSKNIILSPLKTYSIIAGPEKIQYLKELFLPVGFLSLLAPLLLIFALPDLAINLLSSNAAFHQIYYQYTSIITPFVIISAIYGISFILKRFQKIRSYQIIIYLIVITVLGAYLYGPLPKAMRANIDMFSNQLPNRVKIDQFLSKIPTKYSIAASNNLGSHLSHRTNIYTIPNGMGTADVILFLLNDKFAQPSLDAQKTMAKQMSNDKNYLQVYKDGDFIAFEKRSLYQKPKTNPRKGQTTLFPYSIPALSNRGYEKSDISIQKQLSTTGKFSSYIVSFTADGLKEYALMNIPNSQSPIGGFPVVIINHGYIQPSAYDTVNSYKSESDYFASKGFLVLKPDYRGNGDSEIDSTAFMRFAYPIDVLTLLVSLENIPQADKNNVFLWSHSMGGEVTLETLEVIGNRPELFPSVKAAVFWAPVTNPIAWFSRSNLPKLPEARLTPYPYTQTFQLLGTPEENPELWQSLSPLNYLKNIKAPILLQHGTKDTTVPHPWSAQLNSYLSELNKNTQLISYPNDNHNLSLYWSSAISADLDFFNSFLNK